MSRRKRRVHKPTCKSCGLVPARRGNHTTLCAKCYAQIGRPKSSCSVCELSFASDSMQGRRCKPCVSKLNHEKRVMEVYDLAEGDYDRLFEAQDGRCWICGVQPRKLRLAVDHNHTTGEVRGLLCKRCNRNLLGAAHDDTELLQRAIEYLNDPPARRVLAKEA